MKFWQWLTRPSSEDKILELIQNQNKINLDILKFMTGQAEINLDFAKTLNSLVENIAQVKKE